MNEKSIKLSVLLSKHKIEKPQIYSLYKTARTEKHFLNHQYYNRLYELTALT